MFLEKLIIIAGGNLLREVAFKKGLNLVLDETTTDDPTESGNSVGKTTLLRIVDFCLGSDGDDIYKDQEFDRPNQKILTFLKSQNVTAILETIIDSKKMVLTRSFGETEKFKIDDTEYSNKEDYRKALEIRIFDIVDSRPTLRRLMPKFVRKDNDGMSRAVKYCHASTTNNDYELIYTYLFNFSEFDIAKERYFLKKEVRKIKDRITALKNGATLPALRQAVVLINREIAELEGRKQAFNVDSAYDEKLSELNQLKRSNAALSTRMAALETEVQMHASTIQELRSNLSELNTQVIREMYEEAEAYIGKLDKDFESVLGFHNSLIGNKLKFVEKSFEEKNSALFTLKNQLGKNLKEEQEILRLLSREGVFDSVELLYEALYKKYEEKGRREQLILEIERSTEEQANLETRLTGLNRKYELALSGFQENISVFNKYFSKYAKSLYDENFIFTYDDAGETLKFLIENIDGNVGSGKKKATIAAFDFAFMAYFTEIGSLLPRFALHDGIEDISDNQIHTLFEIAASLEGQYVLSVIKDRLKPLELGEEFYKKNTILSLSEADKFFKLD